MQLDGGVLLSEESAEFREWRLKHQREGSLNTAMEYNEPQHSHTHTQTRKQSQTQNEMCSNHPHSDPHRAHS